MKIKRFTAPDMRTAIRLVREEQGPDAVILSTQRVNGGVEIISAVDYDEALIHQAVGQPSAPDPKPAPPRQVQRVPAVAADVPASRRSAAPYRPRPEPRSQSNVAPRRTEPPRAAEPEKPKVVWSQEPTLVSMRREMKGMRRMLESQLASLAWNDVTRREPMRANILRELTQLGLAPDLAREIVTDLPPLTDQRQAWRLPLGHLARRIPEASDDIMQHGGVVSLLGPTGVGKTTTVAKLAARFALQHGNQHVALVSTDTYRIGAHEQLMTYGRLLDVPVFQAGDANELQQVLGRLVDYRLVLIDTAGASQHDASLSQRLSVLNPRGYRLRNYLVLAANAQASALDDVVNVFKRVPLAGCILSKLDEAVTLGGAISTVVRHRLPVAWLTDGQQVPEDLHPARGHQLVTRAVKLARQAGNQADEEYMARKFGGALDAN